MWFKTRVGLVSTADPTEILAAENLTTGTWCVHLRMRSGPEMTTKSVLGKSGSVFNPTCYLAFFSDGPAVVEAIGECMARIEEAIRTKAEVCDLSQAGDEKAWAVAWEQIKWPTRPVDG